MSVNFIIEPINEKPKKKTSRGRKGSKYESIIIAFLKSGYELVKVETDVEANYLAMILNKLAHKKEIDVRASVRNRTLYLKKGIS